MRFAEELDKNLAAARLKDEERFKNPGFIDRLFIKGFAFCFNHLIRPLLTWLVKSKACIKQLFFFVIGKKKVIDRTKKR